MSYADDCLNRILSLPKRESRLEWRRAQRKELKALEATRSALEEKAHIDTALKNHFFITYRFTEDRGFRALGIAPDLDAKWLSQYKKCQRAVRDVYFGVRDDQVRMKLIATQRAIEQHVSKWACGASGRSCAAHYGRAPLNLNQHDPMKIPINKTPRRANVEVLEPKLRLALIPEDTADTTPKRKPKVKPVPDNTDLWQRVAPGARWRDCVTHGPVECPDLAARTYKGGITHIQAGCPSCGCYSLSG